MFATKLSRLFQLLLLLLLPLSDVRLLFTSPESIGVGLEIDPDLLRFVLQLFLLFLRVRVSVRVLLLLVSGFQVILRAIRGWVVLRVQNLTSSVRI